MDSVRQMGVKHEVKLIDMYMNVHVCIVIQIYMWRLLRCCLQLDEVSRATLVVSYKRGVLTIALGRGAKRTYSMVAVKLDLRTTGKYLNFVVTQISLN